MKLSKEKKILFYLLKRGTEYSGVPQPEVGRRGWSKPSRKGSEVEDFEGFEKRLEFGNEFDKETA